MHETIEYWPVSGINIFERTSFVGVGYVKKVMFVKENKKGIKLDSFGRPKFKVDEDRGQIH